MDIATTILFLIICVTCGMLLSPLYGIWAEKKSGERLLLQQVNFGEQALKRTEYERKIETLEAEHRLRIGELERKADALEAQGDAERILIIGGRLRDYPVYLQWQWIEMMADRTGDTVYVPTEAGVPIMLPAKLK